MSQSVARRKKQFLDAMEQAVPWERIEGCIKPHYHHARTGRGRPQMPMTAMIHIHFMQQWFGYSDPAMEEALYDIPVLRAFAGLDAFEDHLPGETTIVICVVTLGAKEVNSIVLSIGNKKISKLIH